MQGQQPLGMEYQSSVGHPTSMLHMLRCQAQSEAGSSAQPSASPSMLMANSSTTGETDPEAHPNVHVLCSPSSAVLVAFGS